MYLLVMVTVSCSTGNISTSSTSTQNQSLSNYNELADYLRTVSGVQVRQQGNSYIVLVRGMASEHGIGEPLFIIDGSRSIGYESAASLVDPNEIRRVEVIKDTASTLSYGLQGANGVIVIHLKR